MTETASLPVAGVEAPGTGVFGRFGLRPVINACGVYTDLGGSVLSPTVWAAMSEVNRSFVSMTELLDRTGAILAAHVGAEAARVTPGASAAIALGTAACMTGMDGKKWEQLPDVTGLKGEFLIQARHRYKYDRCARLAGARLVEVGDSRGTTAAQIEAAIGAGTALLLHPAHLDGREGTVALGEVAAVARRRGVPVFVDAAYMNDPPERMRSFCSAGADLVCFSAKYFGGPNAGGFIAGRADLIAAVAGVDFTRFESGPHLSFGRAFKLDRQIVVGTLQALEEWLAMDHQARWAHYGHKAAVVIAAVTGLPHVEARARWFTMDERLVDDRVSCAALTFAPGSRHTAASVSRALLAGDPAIATVVLDGTLVLGMDTVLDGQEHVIAGRLLSVLTQ